MEERVMSNRGALIGFLILVIILAALFCAITARADTNIIVDAKLADVRFYDGEHESFKILGYYAGAEGEETSASAYLLTNSGGRIWIGNETWRDDRYHAFKFPNFGLGNSSFKTFALTVELQFWNGMTSRIQKNIHVVHRPAPYSAQLASDGSEFMFFSNGQEKFTITVYYNYGPLGQQVETWFDVVGKRTIEMNETRGCTSVDVYVEDGYKNVNSGLEDLEGAPAPYHHAYTDVRDLGGIIVMSLIMAVPLVVLGLVALSARRSAVERALRQAEPAPAPAPPPEPAKEGVGGA